MVGTTPKLMVEVCTLLVLSSSFFLFSVLFYTQCNTGIKALFKQSRLYKYSTSCSDWLALLKAQVSSLDNGVSVSIMYSCMY